MKKEKAISQLKLRTYTRLSCPYVRSFIITILLYHRAKGEENAPLPLPPPRRTSLCVVCRAVATVSLLDVPSQGIRTLIRNLRRLVNFALLIAIISLANEILLVLYFTRYIILLKIFFYVSLFIMPSSSFY